MLQKQLTWIVLLFVTSRLYAGTAFHDPIFGVTQTSNIVYGTGVVNNGASTTNLVLDLYQPANTGTPVPATSPGIVLIHGGGFVSGDKTDMAPLAQLYATYGYNVVSINYRLYPQLPPSSSPGPADNFTPPPAGFDTFPDLQLGDNAINAAVQDAKVAMGWIRDNAATYHVDPNRVAIGGASAGGITSLLEAYTDPSAHVAPTAVLDFLGSMYGTEGSIDAGDAPALIYHGNADTQVPFSGDQAVADQMTAVGVYHEFYIGQGLPHALDASTFNLVYGNETLLLHNIDFLANHLLVAEPSTLALAALGFIGLAAWRLRRR
jgi:acetyl esterase/lipase